MILRPVEFVVNNKENFTYNENSTELLNEVEADIFYLDPPYMITEAGYNSYWSMDDEHMLYYFLDMLDNNGVRFLMSNVRNSAGNLFKTSQGKLFNISTPLRSMLVNTKDMTNKMHAIMTTSLYTNIGISVSLRAFVIGFKIALIIFLIFLIIFISVCLNFNLLHL